MTSGVAQAELHAPGCPYIRGVLADKPFGARSRPPFTPLFLLPLQPPSTVDLTRINLQSTIAVNYWCQVMHCSETQLRNAVLAVGPLPADVQAYLSR